MSPNLIPRSGPQKAPRTRFARYVRRTLGVLVVAAVAIEFLYLIGANTFLLVGGLSKLFESTNTVNVTFRRAWTVVPGHIHARDVRIVFQDHNLQWSLDIPRTTFVLHLSELARMTFHAHDVEGDGAVFRVRHRVDPTSKNEPSVQVVPPIPEFPTPAVFEARVPEAPLSDADYNLWTVQLDHVDVGVREVWIQQFRYVGGGRARGSFRLRPARMLWVGPASLDLDPGALTVGSYLISPGLAGRIDCIVHPFDVRKPDGLEVLRYISAGVKLRAPRLSLTAIELFMPETKLHLRAEDGELLVDARTKYGRFESGSKLELEQRRFLIQHPKSTLELGRARFSALAGSNGRGEARAEVWNGKVILPGSPTAPLELEHVDATATNDSLDPVASWSLAEVRLSDARIQAPDVRWLNGLLSGSNFRAVGGSSAVVARGRYADGELAGDAGFTLGDVHVENGRESAAVDGRATLSWSKTRLADLSGTVTASVIGNRATLRRGRAMAKSGEFWLEGTTESLEGAASARFSAKMAALSLERGKLAVNARAELKGELESWDLRKGTAKMQLDGEFGQVAVRQLDSQTSARVQRITWSVETERRPSSPRSRPPGQRSPRPPLSIKLALRHAELDADLGGEHLDAQAEALLFDARFAQRANADIDLSVHSSAEGVSAAYGRELFRGSPELWVEVTGFDGKRKRGRVRADLTARDFTARDKGNDVDCPWSSIALGRFTADAKLNGEEDPQLRLSGALSKIRLAWGDFSTAATQADFVADSDPKRTRETLLAVQLQGAKLRSGNGTELGWEATVPKLAVKAELRQIDETYDGPLQLVADSVSARIGRTPFTANVAATVGLKHLDPEQKRAIASGAVRITNLGMKLKDDELADWWADVAITSVDVSAKENLDLVGAFRAKLRDGLPALKVLASQGDLPGWVPSLFPLEKLEGAGTLERRCRLTEVGFDWLKGGPFESSGRLQSVTDAVRGAFLVRVAGLNPLSAGVHFDDKDSGVSMFSGKTWLKKQYAQLDKRASTTAVCAPTPAACTN